MHAALLVKRADWLGPGHLAARGAHRPERHAWIDLFAMTATGASTAQDWADLTGGVRLPAWKNGAVTASLTANVPANFPTTYQARLGVTQVF
jgi:hypothetical protein